MKQCGEDKREAVKFFSFFILKVFLQSSLFLLLQPAKDARTSSSRRRREKGKRSLLTAGKFFFPPPGGLKLSVSLSLSLKRFFLPLYREFLGRERLEEHFFKCE